MRGALQGYASRIAFFGTSLTALAGCAVPYGGRPLIPAHTEVVQTSGYTIYKPDIVVEKKDILIHGTICRVSVTAYQIQIVSVEGVSADGRSLGKAEAYIYGMASWRRRGCAFYSAEVTWPITANDTIYVGIPKDVQPKCGPPIPESHNYPTSAGRARPTIHVTTPHAVGIARNAPSRTCGGSKGGT